MSEPVVLTTERGVMTTYSGAAVSLAKPDVRHVSLDDIALGLSQLCRFNGQCRPFYSVAQHSVHVSQRCEPPHALWGLLHDVWETFWGDDIRPKKDLCGRSYLTFEATGDQAVARRFRLDHPIPRAVRDIDDRMLVTEHRDLRKGPLNWNRETAPPEPYPEKIQPWSMDEAYWRFLNRLAELTGLNP